MKKKQSKVTHEKLMAWAKRNGVKTKRVKAAKVNIEDMSGYIWATPRSLYDAAALTASSSSWRASNALGDLIVWVNKHKNMTLRELQMAKWMIEHEIVHRQAEIDRAYDAMWTKPGRGKTAVVRKLRKRKK